MTITVKYKTDRRRWDPTVLYRADVDNVGSITFDYSGELGGDTISTATATTENITAGTPSISSNVVTVAMSGAQEGISKLELKITTAAGNTLSNLVRFRAKDYYDNV